MTYQYKMVPAGFHKLYSGDYTTKALDSLGLEGWLLTQTIYLEGVAYFIFVRPKE